MVTELRLNSGFKLNCSHYPKGEFIKRTLSLKWVSLYLVAPVHMTTFKRSNCVPSKIGFLISDCVIILFKTSLSVSFEQTFGVLIAHFFVASKYDPSFKETYHMIFFMFSALGEKFIFLFSIYLCIKILVKLFEEKTQGVYPNSYINPRQLFLEKV